jgi:hypothetical protein
VEAMVQLCHLYLFKNNPQSDALFWHRTAADLGDI